MKQILVSTIVNSVRTITGYPLDTIKVKMQVENYKKLTMSKCYKDLVYYHGTRGLFKGMLPPLVGSLPQTSLVFTLSEVLKKWLNNKNNWKQETNVLASASLAGTVGLSVLCPFEVIKCRA
mmetsp:Transcript_44371/g.43051  ORF Transcript_44371/g.43051 Transcript_44371/m.43051 type:complete len:121 (+) Transcript_44371:216-578(+)